MNGLVKQLGDTLCAKDDVFFPVESNAKDIFVRDFYPVFFDYFLHTIFPGGENQPGMICLGPPGVGKVLISLHFINIDPCTHLISFCRALWQCFFFSSPFKRALP